MTKKKQERKPTFQEKATEAVRSLFQQLDDEVPELRGAVVLLDWQKELKEVAPPFIWGDFTGEERLSAQAVISLGDALEKLIQHRLKALQRCDTILQQRVQNLQNHLTLIESDRDDEQEKVAENAEAEGS